MMFLAGLALKFGVPQRFAKAAAIAFLVIAAIGLLALLKSCYDSSVVENHGARQDAANTKADRKADESAAIQRQSDEGRRRVEEGALREVNANAQNDRDRRIARQRCIRLQQHARAAGSEPPACR